MRVIAATFSNRKSAERALEQLREKYELGSRDAEVAPFAALETDGDRIALLAGRFYDERDAEVRELIEQHDGEVAVDVDESFTRRPGPTRTTRGAPAGDSGGSPETRASPLGAAGREQPRVYL